jgi:beta-phosphoglucomutase-like phosphatase (HAD superfamily)
MKERSVAALIFDMDGTMVDSMPTHGQSWVAFAQNHGLHIDLHDWLQRTSGRTAMECMELLFGHSLTQSQAKAYVHEKEQLYRDMYQPLFAEVAGFRAFAAHALALGLKVGVGTAGDKDNIAFVMGNLQMPGDPLVTVGGDEGLPGKPEPAIFLEVARRLGVDPAQCVVFEDAPLGIEAARRAAMRAVAICTTSTAEQLAGAHVLAAVAEYNELLSMNFLENHHAEPATR